MRIKYQKNSVFSYANRKKEMIIAAKVMFGVLIMCVIGIFLSVTFKNHTIPEISSPVFLLDAILFDEAENQEKDSFNVEKWVEKYIQKQGDVDVFKEIFAYKLGELNE